MKPESRITRSSGFVFNRILLAFFALTGLIWLFFKLAEAVDREQTRGMESRVVLAFRNPADLGDPLGPIWVEELARDVTGLGGIGVLTFLVLATAGFLWLRKQRWLSSYLLLSVGTGVVLSQLLKSWFDRPRPDLVPHGAATYTASFPSGHSLMAAIVYLTLAVSLARTFNCKRTKVYVMCLATFLVVSVGISRVYLGVHWPTDVLAGWVVGTAWALICGLIANWLLPREVLLSKRP